MIPVMWSESLTWQNLLPESESSGTSFKFSIKWRSSCTFKFYTLLDLIFAPPNQNPLLQSLALYNDLIASVPKRPLDSFTTAWAVLTGIFPVFVVAPLMWIISAHQLLYAPSRSIHLCFNFFCCFIATGTPGAFESFAMYLSSPMPFNLKNASIRHWPPLSIRYVSEYIRPAFK